mgnify:CR=1 FL=1
MVIDGSREYDYLNVFFYLKGYIWNVDLIGFSSGILFECMVISKYLIKQYIQKEVILWQILTANKAW